MILDKYGLEDAIEFQQIEFVVLDGYYFDEGYNKTIRNQIKVIFDRRLEETAKIKACDKQLENETDKAKMDELKSKIAGHDIMQLLYNLVLNVSYGKLIEKTATVDVHYKDKAAVLRFDEKQYNHIKIGQN